MPANKLWLAKMKCRRNERKGKASGLDAGANRIGVGGRTYRILLPYVAFAVDD